MSTDHNEASATPEPLAGVKFKSHSTPAPVLAGAVLVVDDNPVIRQILRRALEHEGFRVLEAETGAKALALVESGLPALIVLDLMMLEMDGFKFLTQLRRRPEQQSVPVVVLSAKPLNPEEHAFVATHAQHFQRKGKTVGEDLAKLAHKFLRPTAA
ncbi:MAG: hypothetical protein RL514_4124 [Verrucomicrobiota bacterium]